MIYPGVQIKPIKGDTLFTDRNFDEIGPDFAVKPIFVHTHVTGSIPQPD